MNRRAFCVRMRQYGLLKCQRGIFCELFTFGTSICRLFSGAEWRVLGVTFHKRVLQRIVLFVRWKWVYCGVAVALEKTVFPFVTLFSSGICCGSALCKFRPLIGELAFPLSLFWLFWLSFSICSWLEYSLVNVIFPKSSTLLYLMDRSVPLILIFSSLDAWSHRFWLFNCKFLYPISSHNSFITSIYPLFLPFSLQGGFSEETSSCAFFLHSKTSMAWLLAVRALGQQSSVQSAVSGATLSIDKCFRNSRSSSSETFVFRQGEPLCHHYYYCSSSSSSSSSSSFYNNNNNNIIVMIIIIIIIVIIIIIIIIMRKKNNSNSDDNVFSSRKSPFLGYGSLKLTSGAWHDQE